MHPQRQSKPTLTAKDRRLSSHPLKMGEFSRRLIIKVEGNNAPANPQFENSEPAAVFFEQLIAAVKLHINPFKLSRAPESNR